MRSTAFHALLILLFAAPLMAAERSPAPGPDCMDARRMQEARQVSGQTLAVALDDGERFRLSLASDCPRAIGVAGAMQVLSREGWVCPADAARIRTADGETCPILGVERIDPRTYAELAREARDYRGLAGVARLDPIEVVAERRRGFARSTNFCLAARHLRSWSQDSEGFVIEVAPRRSGGNRYYRVEVQSGCTLPPNARAAIALQSGIGNGVICGYPGDEVQVVGEEGAGSMLAGEASFANRQWPIIGTQCPVVAVYPLPMGRLASR